MAQTSGASLGFTLSPPTRQKATRLCVCAHVLETLQIYSKKIWHHLLIYFYGSQSTKLKMIKLNIVNETKWRYWLKLAIAWVAASNIERVACTASHNYKHLTLARSYSFPNLLSS